jgi:hypothetical protein
VKKKQVGDERYFTVEEANGLVPILEVHFAQVFRLKPQLQAVQKELEALGEPPTEQSVQRSDGPPALVSARGRFRALVEALSDELNAVGELGVHVKDLDIGLCDFLGKVDNKAVWLCWQYGEPAVAYYHDLDSGFAGRRPLVPAKVDRVLH